MLVSLLSVLRLRGEAEALGELEPFPAATATVPGAAGANALAELGLT